MAISSGAVVARAASVAVIAGLIGPEAYGTYAYALGVSLVGIWLARFGTSMLITRNVGLAEQPPGEIVTDGAVLRAMTASIAGIGIVGWAHFAGHAGETLLLIGIFTLALMLRSGASLFHDGMIGLERADLVARLEAVRLAGELIGLIALAILGAPLWALALVTMLSWFAQLLASARLFGPLTLLRSGLGTRLWRLLREGAPFALAGSLLTWMVMSPLLVAESDLTGTAELGHIALSVQLTIMLRNLPGGVILAALPLVVRAVERSDGKDERVAAAMIHGIAAICGAGIVLAPGPGAWAAERLLGPSYAGLADLLPLAAMLLLPGALLVTFEMQAIARRIVALHAGAVALGALATWLSTASDAFGTGVSPLFLSAVAGLWIACGFSALALALRGGGSLAVPGALALSALWVALAVTIAGAWPGLGSGAWPSVALHGSAWVVASGLAALLGVQLVLIDRRLARNRRAGDG